MGPNPLGWNKKNTNRHLFFLLASLCMKIEPAKATWPTKLSSIEPNLKHSWAHLGADWIFHIEPVDFG